ncbi:MAG: hypothetical protein M1834_002880 [Cirrosporium novae-zelandiae]|nr:MAG: hypothetical protein M1834_002880 [Cirrosporium novae-zelandiae]
MTKQIHRVTLFKVSKEEDVQAMLAQYRELSTTAVKVFFLLLLSPLPPITLFPPPTLTNLANLVTWQDSKPYIVSCTAGKTFDDARNKGYTLVAKTVFKDLEDMKYYDVECEAHTKLKGMAKGKVSEPPLTCYYEDEVMFEGKE